MVTVIKEWWILSQKNSLPPTIAFGLFNDTLVLVTVFFPSVYHKAASMRKENKSEMLEIYLTEKKHYFKFIYNEL